LKDLEKENQNLRRALSYLTLGKLILSETAGKIVSRSRRQKCFDHVLQDLGTSERRVCRSS